MLRILPVSEDDYQLYREMAMKKFETSNIAVVLCTGKELGKHAKESSFRTYKWLDAAPLKTNICFVLF